MNKKLIIAALSVVLIFLGIDFIFGKTMDWLSSHSKGGDTRNIHYICNEFNDPIAIFGSSRANHHYDVSILSDILGMPAYNCGKDGNGILLSYALLQNMIKEGHIPSMVIYDFFPKFDLADNNDHLRAVDVISQYFRKEGMKDIINDLTPGDYYKMFLATYRYNSKFIQILSDAFTPKQKVIKGYKPLEGTINTKFSADDTPFESVDSLKIKYFEKFINLCEDNSIDLYFITSPVFHMAEKPESYDSIFKTYVSKKYPLMDFRNDSDYINHNELFVDPSHMNHLGAKKFSQNIADCIKSISKRY